MNFKDEYKREFASIRMDENFKNSLADEMNKMTPARGNFKVYATVLAAAAALAIAVGVGSMGAVSKEGDFGMKAETVTTATSNEGIFVSEKWYGDAASDEEIYAEFAKLMESGTLEKLYCSNEESFEDEDILSHEAADELAGKLASAVAAEGEVKGNTKNYMAVFENGEIVKFQVSDEGYVKLKDIKTVYQYKK